jgi:hypothetical protein
LSIALLVVACTRSSEKANPAGSNAVPTASDAAVTPQISDAPDPLVAVDAGAEIAAKPTPADKPSDKPSDKPTDTPIDTPADKPSDKPTALVQCGADADCVLTMIPAQPACCRQLCAPRAVAKSTLPGLEAKQNARDCKAVLCAPPAPCPRGRAVKAVCDKGACVAR